MIRWWWKSRKIFPWLTHGGTHIKSPHDMIMTIFLYTFMQTPVGPTTTYLWGKQDQREPEMPFYNHLQQKINFQLTFLNHCCIEPLDYHMDIHNNTYCIHFDTRCRNVYLVVYVLYSDMHYIIFLHVKCMSGKTLSLQQNHLAAGFLQQITALHTL